VIYASYNGYDIVAHHSGPVSRNSLRVLRGIDGAIRKLFETRAWAERRYDVLLLSDHGMSPCQPVVEAFDQDFEEWVESWWRQGAQVPTFRARGGLRRLRFRQRRRSRGLLGRIAGTVARRSSGWLRTQLPRRLTGAVAPGPCWRAVPGDDQDPVRRSNTPRPPSHLVREVDRGQPE
jgi:hypothetical protein